MEMGGKVGGLDKVPTGSYRSIKGVEKVSKETNGDCGEEDAIRN